MGADEDGEASATTSDRTAEWPVDLHGVTESLVTSRGPDGNWNVAALGLRAGDPVTARTWGRTRTWRNFDREGRGYVQFTRDPRLFVRAALDIVERSAPMLEEADAWAEVTVARRATGSSEGTEWTDWRLTPVESAIERRVVPTTNRGYNAVIEATVAASRLDVDAYDRTELLDRLDYFEAVVQRCGSEQDREAIADIFDLVDVPGADRG